MPEAPASNNNNHKLGSPPPGELESEDSEIGFISEKMLEFTIGLGLNKGVL